MNYRHRPLKDKRNIPHTPEEIQQHLKSIKLIVAMSRNIIIHETVGHISSNHGFKIFIDEDLVFKTNETEMTLESIGAKQIDSITDYCEKCNDSDMIYIYSLPYEKIFDLGELFSVEHKVESWL